MSNGDGDKGEGEIPRAKGKSNVYKKTDEREKKGKKKGGKRLTVN